MRGNSCGRARGVRRMVDRRPTYLHCNRCRMIASCALLLSNTEYVLPTLSYLYLACWGPMLDRGSLYRIARLLNRFFTKLNNFESDQIPPAIYPGFEQGTITCLHQLKAPVAVLLKPAIDV